MRGMMKRIGAGFLAFAMIMTLSACSRKPAEVENTKVDTPVVTEQVLTQEEQLHKELIERSLLGPGNNNRVKKVIEKARNGEDITIAFLGGSITEGYNSGESDNYAELVTKYFAETFSSKEKVHMVNAGLGGTPSTLGLIRSDRDVFDYQPDILFIEFAVNDSQTGSDPAAFESLIAKALRQENNMAVILLFSVTENGYSCQTQMGLSGFKFKVPMISVSKALQPEFDAGRMTWDDWSNDEVHPDANGHKLYSEFIINYLNTVDAAGLDDAVSTQQYGKMITNYTDMVMYDKTNTDVQELGSFGEKEGHDRFQNGWMKSNGSEENEEIRFQITAESFFIVYKEMKDTSFGSAKVYVDGVETTTLPGYTPDGWGNPKTALIFHKGESQEHTIEIKMAEGDEEKAFAILALGICP